MGSTSRDLARVVYEAIPPIKAFHAVPRFGHSADITSIFVADTNADVTLKSVTDYLLGTIFICAFCLAALLLWLCALIICKCFGKRAGICAGHPLEDSTYASKEGARNRNSNRNGQQKRTSRKGVIWRIIMICCSIIIVSSGFLFLFRGAISIAHVYDDMRDVTSGLAEFTKSIVDSTSEVITFGENTVELKDSIKETLEKGVCASSSLLGVNGTSALLDVNGTSVGVEIQKEFDIMGEQVVELLTVVQDFSKNELTDLRDLFDTEFEPQIKTFEEYTVAGETYVRPLYASAPVIAFGFLLMIGCMLAWKGGESCSSSAYFKVQTWLILPLFSILCIVIGIVISFLGSILVINSDICLGGESKSPEGLIESFLDTQGDSLGNLTHEAFDFYVINGCEGDFSSKNEANSLVRDLNSAVDGIHDLYDMLESNQADLELVCGGEEGSLDELKDILVMSGEKFSNFVNITEGVVDSLRCNRINDIFVDLFHDLLCTSVPYTLTWVFATMMSVFVLGMFMVLCRGTLLPTHYTHVNIDREQTFEMSKSDGSDKLYSYNGDVGIVSDAGGTGSGTGSHIENEPKYDLSGPSDNRRHLQDETYDGGDESSSGYEDNPRYDFSGTSELEDNRRYRKRYDYGYDSSSGYEDNAKDLKDSFEELWQDDVTVSR